MLCHCTAVLIFSCVWFSQVGERLARYDVEKRYAIEKEDYDLAKKKKELMEEYRKNVYQQLAVHNLMDMVMVSHSLQLTVIITCNVSKKKENETRMCKTQKFNIIMRKRDTCPSALN